MGGSSPATEADTKLVILREAAALFATRGYDAVSVREIVEASGVTKPALYYHFGSKEGVARAMVEYFLQAATEMRTRVFAQAGAVRELLELYTGEMLELAQQHRNTLAFAFSLWFGRSSLKELIRHAEEYDTCAVRDWTARLGELGMSQHAAQAAVRAYWALLMQELMKVVQCPRFEGCARTLATDMATLVLHGAAAFNEESDV
ncbi:MAG: TetR/AcrR family transcriptional regulator [Planctomycetota bacterium]|nr:TetR/AcrR family transcriptional regulator [Planctomycetota bacterium]